MFILCLFLNETLKRVFSEMKCTDRSREKTALWCLQTWAALMCPARFDRLINILWLNGQCGEMHQHLWAGPQAKVSSLTVGRPSDLRRLSEKELLGKSYIKTNYLWSQMYVSTLIETKDKKSLRFWINGVAKWLGLIECGCGSHRFIKNTFCSNWRRVVGAIVYRAGELMFPCNRN